jgi:hypothetical protein
MTRFGLSTVAIPMRSQAFPDNGSIAPPYGRAVGLMGGCPIGWLQLKSSGM